MVNPETVCGNEEIYVPEEEDRWPEKCGKYP